MLSEGLSCGLWGVARLLKFAARLESSGCVWACLSRRRFFNIPARLAQELYKNGKPWPNRQIGSERGDC